MHADDARYISYVDGSERKRVIVRNDFDGSIIKENKGRRENATRGAR